MRVYFSVSAPGHTVVEAQTPAQLTIEFPPKGDNPPRTSPLHPLVPGEPRELFLWPGIKLVLEELP